MSSSPARRPIYQRQRRRKAHAPGGLITRRGAVLPMRLTTQQIAGALGVDASNARRRIARWAAEGVDVRDALTGGRPTRTVAVEDVALRAGLTVDGVLALAGLSVERAAA